MSLCWKLLTWRGTKASKGWTPSWETGVQTDERSVRLPVMQACSCWGRDNAGSGTWDDWGWWVDTEPGWGGSSSCCLRRLQMLDPTHWHQESAGLDDRRLGTYFCRRKPFRNNHSSHGTWNHRAHHLASDSGINHHTADLDTRRV